jgi:predicted Zn-dependent protease
LSNSVKRKKGRVEITHHRAERLFLKLSLGASVGIVLLIAVIWAGRGGYVRWQKKRLVRRAESALQRGDGPTASLAMRAVLQLKPDSIPGARIAAELAERSGDRGALSWWRKVAQAEPHSAEDVLAWARCALQFNELPTAKVALAELQGQERQTAGFHAAAALLAQAEKQNDLAEREWAEAVRLAPREKAYQLQLGAAQLRLNDPAQRDSGAAILIGLRPDNKYRVAAARTLINEGIAHGDGTAKILQFAQDLRTYPEATFTDRLVVADLLRQAKDPDFASYLSELEKSAFERAQDLAALLTWMSEANLNVLALDFVRNLKPEILQQWPVSMAVTEIYVRLKDWSKLEQATKSVDWRDFDFLRHAYLARALRGEDEPAAAKREWALATKGAAIGSGQTMMLLRAMSAWGWEDEEIDLLWALAKYPEKEKEALQTLYRYYVKNHDTQGLYRTLVRLAEDNPDNLDIQNNLAQVSLLLDAKTDDARRIAAEVYHKAPTNAAYAATYAYALLTKGDAKGAGKVMSSLSGDQLKDPAVSAYYGICLAALKDERAREFLHAGASAMLLPEEKALLEKARNGLESEKPQ